jgi:hypothetical protein
MDPIYERAGAPPPTPLDRILAPRGNSCSDAVFVRRIFLDVTGTLPTAAEAAAFLKDPDRTALIDRLLASDGYPAYYAMKWSDILRVKAEFPVNLWPNAAQAYYHWIRAALAANQPYDRFARELLTSSGSNFRDPAVNFYRALQSREPQAIAQAVSQTFLGVPPPPDSAGFFSQIGYKSTKEWKEEIVYFDPSKRRGPTFLSIPPNQDPREVFAAWLTSPRNPYFAKAIVTRIWTWLLDTPPQSPELFSYLSSELTSHRYDLKHVYRLILASNTYQLSPIPPPPPNPRPLTPDSASAASSSYPLRRLDAEVLADAINSIAGTTDSYTSAIPEPYTFMPDDQRAVELPDGSITSAFLDLFGKPARDTGLETERNNRMTDAQRLHLLNSTSIQRKLQQGPHLAQIRRESRDPRELVNQLYLTILSRYPSETEWKLIQSHGQLNDLPWALLNSTEFLCRH